jgi:hypothetical protein
MIEPAALTLWRMGFEMKTWLRPSRKVRKSDWVMLWVWREGG